MSPFLKRLSEYSFGYFCKEIYRQLYIVNRQINLESTKCNIMLAYLCSCTRRKIKKRQWNNNSSMCIGLALGGIYADRVCRSFSVRSEIMRHGSKIPFASKQNREACFACFALKRNSKFHLWKEKEMKRKMRSKKIEAKRNKDGKRKKAKIKGSVKRLE